MTLRDSMRWVCGLEGRYAVDADGACYSFVQGEPRRLKTSVNRGGYERVVFYQNGMRRRCRVHRVVLEAFVGPCPDGMECDHIDGNKTNNALANLEWVSRSEQMRRAHALGLCDQSGEMNNAAKVTAEVARMVRYLHEHGYAQSVIEHAFGMGSRSAWHIVKRRTWRDVGEATENEKERALLIMAQKGKK